MKLKIAALQARPTGTLAGNLEKGVALCREAAKMGADIILFPEMWSNGYGICSPYNDTAAAPEVWERGAVAPDGDFVLAFAAEAKALGVAIGVTLLEAHSPAPRNTLLLIDRHGNTVLHYAKVHTCDFGDERALSPGDDFYVTELDTARGPVKVGAMICYDREFPESARVLMLKGAEIVLVPNACPMEINRLSQLRARAFENMVGIITCNYPAGHPDCNGASSAFDGVAYLPDMPGSRDMCVMLAPGDEGIYLAEFDLDMMRTYRESEVHGNAYRRPEKYGILLSDKVSPPFIRSDKR